MKPGIDRTEEDLYLRLADSPVVESERIAPGVIVDLDRRNKVVGVEVLHLSRRTRVPEAHKLILPSPSLVHEKPAKKYGS